LGIGPNPQYPKPKTQNPIPNCKKNKKKLKKIFFLFFLKFLKNKYNFQNNKKLIKIIIKIELK